MDNLNKEYTAFTTSAKFSDEFINEKREMKQTISIELTDEQINKIVESRQPKLPIQPETFSIIGASKVIGISKSKIHQLIREGKISKIMIGKSPRITKSEIDKFLGPKEAEH